MPEKRLSVPGARLHLVNILDLLSDTGAETDWIDRAACATEPAEMFVSSGGTDCEHARAVCRRCPVRLNCLAYAEEHHETGGIWGGGILR